VIELNEVTKLYRERPALNRVSLIVPSNQTTVLIGPSGCGKSTLLRSIIGLIHPEKGTITIDGTVVHRENISELRKTMGYVIQEGGLFPHLSARDNLALVPRVLRWKKDRIQERILELAKLTAIPQETLDRYPSEISGGQRQRISLMRALMLNPSILLLDEPLGALDPIIRSELQEDLRSIFQKLGKTVLLVTHDLGEAGFFGDQIVLMKDGSIVQQGSLASLVQSPINEFVTKFIYAQRRPLEALGR
jgi:osmoprotectant transport system ATP-binding protein